MCYNFYQALFEETLFLSEKCIQSFEKVSFSKLNEKQTFKDAFTCIYISVVYILIFILFYTFTI